jgi:hypothetical protein
MKLKSNIAISDSGFIFNPSNGDSFSTNPVGLEIIRLLKDEQKKEFIVKSICEKFMIDESTQDKDLVDFLIMLENLQLLKDEE